MKATSERVLVEQRFLTWYSWFLTQGTPLTMRAARNVIARLEKKQQDLEGIRNRKEWSGKQSRRRMAEFVRHLYQEPASWQSASFATLVAALVKYDISLQELAVLAQPSVLHERSEP
jgi:hypothetical protein